MPPIPLRRVTQSTLFWTAIVATAAVLAVVLAHGLTRSAQAITVQPPCTSAAIQSALSAGGVVTFDCGTITIPITTTLVVTNSVTLDGGNLVTLGGQGTRILSVTAGTAFTLANIALIDGLANDGVGGGAIHLGGDAILAGSNVTFVSNRVVGFGLYGGAIGGLVGSRVTISGSTMVSNSAEYGGAINANHVTLVNTMLARNQATNGSGGAVHANYLTTTATTVVSNVASLTGGGLAVINRATVSGTQLLTNTAGTSGGGIVVDDGTLFASLVQSNTATTGSGGGVFASTALTVANGSVVSNTAAASGGGVAAATVLMNGSLVNANTATGNGGGLFAPSVFLSDTIVSRNVASQPGGGLYVGSTATIVGSTISDNRSDSQGGGLFASGSLTVTDSAVISNMAPGGSGAVSVVNARFTNSTIAGNNSGSLNAVSFATTLHLINTTVMSNGTPVLFAISPVSFTLNNSIIGGPGPLCNVLGTALGGTLVADSTCGGSATPNLLLGPLQDNGGRTLTMAPLPGSPAIGTASGCLPADQRGALRFAPCDVGAYETGAAPTLVSISPASTPVLAPDLTLTVTGSGFISGTILLWNGSPRPTVVQSDSLLTATIPTADLSAVGPVTVQARYGLAPDSLSNSLPFNVVQASQSITFPQLPDRTLADPPFVVSATASSGLAVSFSASGQCSLSGTLVTISAAGLCTVTATQSGNASYAAAAPVVRTFAITKASQSITFAPLADRILADPPFQVSATASSGLPVSFGVSGNCTIVGVTVTATGFGTCTVTASQAGNTTFDAAPPVVRSFAITTAGNRVITLPAIGKDRETG